MPQVSATLKPTIKKIVDCYSVFHEISFSESLNTLVGLAALEWWNKLSKKQQKELNDKKNGW